MIEYSIKASKRHCPRCYFPFKLVGDKLVTITESTFHHLFTVLRLKTKANIKLFNENDGEWLAEVINITKHNANLKLLKQLRSPSAPFPDLILAFAPIKPSNLHFLLEKATELGVTKLLPVITEFTQIKQLNYNKLESIIISAAEQCERMTIPNLYQAITLQDLLKNKLDSNFPEDIKVLVAHPDGNLTHEFSPPHDYMWLVGPEGGFSKNEINQLCNSSMVKLCKLGNNVLRSETSAIVALTISNRWNNVL